MDDERATQNSTLKTQNFDGALAIKEALMRRGVLVRYYRKPGLDDCIRVSVGTPAQNDALLAAIEEVLDA